MVLNVNEVISGLAGIADGLMTAITEIWGIRGITPFAARRDWTSKRVRETESASRYIHMNICSKSVCLQIDGGVLFIGKGLTLGQILSSLPKASDYAKPSAWWSLVQTTS